MKRPIVIYHGNCADGFAAAWCFWRLYKDQFLYVPGVYSQPPPDVADRDVMLVDFSYKRAVVEEIIEVANNVVLIDHHKTAIEDLAGVAGLQQFISIDHSGAILAWKFLMGDIPPPRLLQHIEDRDLWKFALPHTREIQSNLFSYPYNFAVWDELIARFETGDNDSFVQSGAAIERKLHKDVAELVQVCQRLMNIGGYTGIPVASLPYTYVSDAAYLMAKETGAPFAACYWDTPTGRVFGLRSVEGGVDVSIVATQYGGGGHKHAAGFTVPRDHQLAQG